MPIDVGRARDELTELFDRYVDECRASGTWPNCVLVLSWDRPMALTEQEICLLRSTEGKLPN